MSTLITRLSSNGTLFTTGSFDEVTNNLINGAIAYWKLNDSSWTDSTGNGNTLTNVGGTVTNSSGIITNGAMLSGSYLRNTDIRVSLPLTVSGWFKVNAWPDNYPYASPIIALQNSNSTPQSGGDYQLSLNIGNRAYGQPLGLVACFCNGWVASDYNSTNPITNQWTFFSFSVDSSGNEILYINNKKYTGNTGTNSPEGTNPVSSWKATSFNRITIGTDGFSPYPWSSSYKLEVDEVGIWNRVLTDLEIQTIYNSGIGKTYPFSTSSLISYTPNKLLLQNSFFDEVTNNTSTLKNGVVAYWNFDEVNGIRYDTTGNGYNLSATNSVMSVSGVLTNAVYLSSVPWTTEYQKSGPWLRTITTGPVVSGTAITISAWIKTTDTDGFIVNSVTASKWTGGGYQFNVTGGKLEFGLFDGKGDSPSPGKYYNLIGTKSINDNVWYHVAGTFANGKMCTYVNGVLDASTPSFTALTTFGGDGSNTTGIGNNADITYSSGVYTGSIDETGIWNRALTSSEIFALYNNGNALKYPFTKNTLLNGALAYWSLDNSSWTDTTNNNNSLSAIGTPTLITGINGNAVELNNSSVNYFRIPKGVMDIGAKQKTINFWFRIPTSQPNIFKWFFADGTNADYQEMFIALGDTTQALAVAFNTNSHTGAPWSYAINTSFVPAIGTWYMATVSFTGSSCKIYVNGSLISTTPYTGALNASNTSYYLGHFVPHGGDNNTIDFDEIGIWNRDLNISEILALYNNGSATKYPFTIPALSQTSNSLLVSNYFDEVKFLQLTQPTQINDLFLWNDAADYSTLVFADNSTTMLSAWKDKSGYGRDFIQDGTYSPGGSNNYPRYLTPSRSQSTLKCVALSATAPYNDTNALFFVNTKSTDFDAVSGTFTCFVVAKNNNQSRGIVVLSKAGNTDPRRILDITVGYDYSLLSSSAQGHGDAAGADFTIVSPFNTNIYTYRWDSFSSFSAFQNGRKLPTRIIGTPAFGTNPNPLSLGLSVGFGGAGQVYHAEATDNAEICEILLYNRTLTDLEASQINQYLFYKWYNN